MQFKLIKSDQLPYSEPAIHQYLYISVYDWDSTQSDEHVGTIKINKN